jgi:hypothetical protein
MLHGKGPEVVVCLWCCDILGVDAIVEVLGEEQPGMVPSSLRRRNHRVELGSYSNNAAARVRAAGKCAPRRRVQVTAKHGNAACWKAESSPISVASPQNRPLINGSSERFLSATLDGSLVDD